MSALRNNSQRDNSLPKSRILRGGRNFARIFSGSDRSSGNCTEARYLFFNQPDDGLKVAFAAGKKTGNAVERNRYKRMMREGFRTSQHVLLDRVSGSGHSIHIVFVARRGIRTTSRIQSEMVKHIQVIDEKFSQYLKLAPTA